MDRGARTRAERRTQRMALLPGRRPDVLLDDGMALLRPVAAAVADRLRLVVPAQPGRAVRRPERARRDAGRAGAPGAAVASDRSAVRLRHRRPYRRTADRLRRRAAVDRPAVRGDPAVRRPLP